MCELCGTAPETEAARERMRSGVRRLRDLATRLEGLANGRMEPHSDASERLGKDFVREAHRLIKEWA